MTPVLVDTGFLLALFRADELSASATRYLREHRHALVTVLPVVVEACFRLTPAQKRDLLGWLSRGGASVADTPVSAYAAISHVLGKYADQDLDFADATLVWLANESGTRRVLTVDRTDFEVIRLAGGKRFEIVDWY